MEGEGGREDALAIRGDAVEALAGDLGDKMVPSELGDEPGDAGATAVGLRGGGWWSRVEVSRDVGVAEAGDGVPASEHGPEQGQVGGAERVEAGVVVPVSGPWPAQGVDGTSSPLRGAAASASR